MTQSVSSFAAAEPEGAWADLFRGRNLAVVTVMAGGVLLYAMNLYFTAALLPSIVAGIGGQEFYAWVTTGLSATFVPSASARRRASSCRAKPAV